MGLVGEGNENLFCCRIGEMAGFSMLLSHPRGFLASLGFSSLTICLHEMIRRMQSTRDQSGGSRPSCTELLFQGKFAVNIVVQGRVGRLW